MKAFFLYCQNRMLVVRTPLGGFGIRDVRRHRLYFSERNGLVPMLKIGNVVITAFRREG